MHLQYIQTAKAETILSYKQPTSTLSDARWDPQAAEAPASSPHKPLVAA